MDVLLLLLLFITATGIILVALKDCGIYDITNKNQYLKKLPQFSLGLFVIFSVCISFYDFESVLSSLETMAFIFMFGFTLKVLWSMLVDKNDLAIWLRVWAGASVVAGAIQLIVHINGPVINNIVEFGVIVIACLFSLAILGIIMKNEYAPLLVRGLFVSYGVVGLLMGLISPFDIEVAIATWLIVFIPGLFVGGIIRSFYKKRFAPVDEMIGLSDYHENKELL